MTSSRGNPKSQRSRTACSFSGESPLAGAADAGCAAGGETATGGADAASAAGAASTLAISSPAMRASMASIWFHPFARSARMTASRSKPIITRLETSSACVAESPSSAVTSAGAWLSVAGVTAEKAAGLPPASLWSWSFGCQDAGGGEVAPGSLKSPCTPSVPSNAAAASAALSPAPPGCREVASAACASSSPSMSGPSTCVAGA
mmetsp:Transcript_144938/g.361515  ORF Transcript_144938/g.361515 Transcript_144938/m.361515 type:complete len:205 (-) Transcript_144938:116-730(-)